MLFTFGPFQIDADVERTRDFYRQMPYVTEGCGCIGCRNFEKAVDVLPAEVLHFFDSLGIDLKKATEPYECAPNPDGTVIYGGFTHLCGTMVAGENAWVKEDEDDEHSPRHFDLEKTYAVSERFHVSVSDECDLVEDGFPAPVLQLEWEADIPWVLDEPYPRILP